MTPVATPPSFASSPRWSSRTLLLLALLPFLGLALWNLRAPLDLSIGDQAQYLLHARSIVEGRGYTDDGYIYYPRVAVSPKAYPPGVPVVVAAVQMLGGSLSATRVLMLVAALVFLFVAGRYLATYDDPLLGPAAILLCAFIPNLPRFAVGIYSDFAFAAAAWGCCLLADRPGRWSAGRIAALSALGALAITFRTIGVALIPAIVLYQVWRTWRHDEPWTRAVVPLLVWTATYVTISQLLPVTQGYALQITSAGSDGAVKPGVGALVMLLLRRVMAYRDFVSGFQLVPTPWRLVNLVYHAAALVAAVIGAIAWVRRAGVRFLFCFIVVYVGIFLLIPWAIGRFLWPLLPVIWYVTLDGARVILQTLRVERSIAARTSVLAAVVVAIVAMVAGPAPDPLVGVGDLREGRELYAALEQEAAIAPIRTLTFDPRDAARLKGVSAMSVPPLQPDSLLAEAENHKITHAVLGGMGDVSSDRFLRAALAAHPERFHEVYSNPKFTLYRVLPAMVSSSPPSASSSP